MHQLIRLQHTILCILFVALLAACDNQPQVQEVPTATLISVGRLTPAATATIEPTRTPPPTFTYTPSITPIPPSPTDTLTPTLTPPVIGIVNSPFEAINVREGPGTNNAIITSIAPGTGVEIIARTEDGGWLLILLEDGRQGWVSSNLIRLENTVTPVPSATPTPNETAIALGSPLPTSVIGGTTVTPTPPGAVVSATPVTATPRTPATQVTGTPGLPNVPSIDFDSINLTATALAGGLTSPTPRPPATSTLTIGSPPNTTITPVATTPASGQTTITPPANFTSSGAGIVQEDVQVLAVCDDRSQGFPAPTSLGAGSTIRIWWSWFARTRQQVEDHLDAATYEVRLDGILLPNINLYRTNITQRAGDYVVSWYVPAGPLAAGPHQITYRVTWSRTISDGYDNFGPGTNRLVEEGSCVFTVN